MATNSNSRNGNGAEERSLRQREVVTALFALILALGLTLILSFNLIAGQSLSVTPGEPSSQEVIAPQSKSYISEVLTAEARERAANTIADVYSGPDLNIARAQRDLAQSLFNYIDVVRADSVADLATKIDYLQAIEGLAIGDGVAQTVVTLAPADYEAVRANILFITEEIMRGEIRPDTLNTARRTARQRVSFSLSDEEVSVVTAIAPQLIVANTFFDETATAERREQAAASVAPIRRLITKDEQLLRVGETVDAADIEALEQLNLLRRQTSWTDVSAIFLASLITAVLLALYWQRYHAHFDRSGRSAMLVALVILAFTLAAKLMLSGGAVLPYLFPMAALSMLLAVVFDARLSIIVTVTLALLFAFAVDSALETAVYVSAGGLLAVLTLRDPQRINALFRAGLVAAVGNVAVILIFRIGNGVDPVETFQLMIWGVTNGLILSAGLTLAGLFLVGSVFGVVTLLQLQELSRLDHPILRELLRRAPGTYHHSIMVANLAEQAAERIKANSSLVRVGAFYHDIGKINRPPFFTENQAGVNPHDSLDPYVSARIIRGHVSDGMDLARKHKLPHEVQDFIATHHGDRLIRAFYAKALERAGDDPEKVDISRFRHNGPRPRTRETGIVLLADAIEAVSSALRPNTSEAIEKLVGSIVDEDLRTGQLDYTGLTLSDIHQLRASFIDTLKGRFHIRVRYPGNEELEDVSPPQEGLPAPKSTAVALAGAAGPPAQSNS